MVTVEPAPGVSTLPESSYARLRIVADTSFEPGPPGVQLYVHDEVPDAWCQVTPLSVEASTFVTTPPPESVAVPEIVIALPLCTVEPLSGDVTVDVGAAVWS